MPNKLTTEEFIKKAKIIHGNKYDYSKVNYVNRNTSVCIICRKHGEFWQTPKHHLIGNGCKECAYHKMSTEDILNRLKSIYSDYEFLTFNYINNKQKILFKCPIHGIQTKPINKLLEGRGCHLCRSKIPIIGVKKKHTIWTTSKWIKECKKIFKNKYKYDEVVYKNNKIKVKIYCTEKDKHGNDHGYFYIRPNNFINGKQGCPKCAKNKIKNISKSKKLTNEKFIEKAKKIHGNKYDYSKVTYVNNRTKVCIICHIHGEFWQTPDKHLRHNGCPKCHQSNLEKNIELFLKEKKINFIYQKNFNWLGRMSVDFYLPNYNVAIECQGIQHFIHTDFFEPLEVIQKRDEVKKELCSANGIKLLYYSNLGINYPYKVFEDKNELFENF